MSANRQGVCRVEDSGAGLKSGGELKVSSLLEFAQGSAEFTAVEFQLFLRW